MRLEASAAPTSSLSFRQVMFPHANPQVRADDLSEWTTAHETIQETSTRDEECLSRLAVENLKRSLTDPFLFTHSISDISWASQLNHELQQVRQSCKHEMFTLRRLILRHRLSNLPLARPQRPLQLHPTQTDRTCSLAPTIHLHQVWEGDIHPRDF
jgi:hypothetical protein